MLDLSFNSLSNNILKYIKIHPLKNYVTILTMSLIGLKIDTAFVFFLPNRPVVLKG